MTASKILTKRYKPKPSELAKERKALKKLKDSRKGKLKSWHTCQDCAIRAGGVWPDNEMPKGITLMAGTCPDCGAERITLIPLEDFDWPETGEKAVWD